MKISFFFKIYQKTFLFYKQNSRDQLKDIFDYTNLKPSFLQIFKSDLLIKLFFSTSLIIISIVSINFRYLKVVRLTLPFIEKKLLEILYSSLFLQNKNFNEVPMISNYQLKKNIYKNIIIGSGPAGAITGYHLSKIYKDECLMVEAGKKISLFKNKHPGKEFIFKWLNSGFNTTIFPNLVPFSSGKCLGGGSEINSGLFHFPTDNFISEWKRKFNVYNLNYEKLSNDLKEILKFCPAKKYNSTNRFSSKKFFLDGAKKNNLSFENVPYFYSNTDPKLKNSMSKTFLNYYEKNRGEFATNLEVKKIKQMKDKSWNIYAYTKKKLVILKTERIFLNCGAMQTNKILINSNIEGKFDNFNLHPMIKVIVEFNEKVQVGGENVHSYQLDHFFPEFIIGEASSGDQFLKIMSYESKKYFKHISDNSENMSIYHATFSFGSGKLIKLPFINNFLYLYKIQEKELKTIKKALNIMCKIMFDGNAKNIFISINNDLKKLDKFNFIEILNKISSISDLKYSSVHILGGVKSGESKQCSFDSYGEHKKLKNLFVSDSSVINHKLLKNPQGTVMAIAYRNIKHFLNKSLIK